MKLEEPDYAVSSQEQDVIIRRKLAQASLEHIKNNYVAEIPNNELLESLTHKLESDIGFLNHMRETEPEQQGHEYVARYQEITRELLEMKRSMLHQFNKKEMFEEEVVRQHLAQLDLEEEKIRQQFLHIE
jgi:monovalent cation/hydrogen antiporter